LIGAGRSALTLTDQTPIPVTAQIPIPRYVYVGPDRSAGLVTKEAPAIPTQVVGASSIFALRRPGAETHIHRARAAHSAQLVRRPFAGRSLIDRFHQTSKLVHPSKPAENSTSRPVIGGQAAHQGRRAADRGLNGGVFVVMTREVFDSGT